MLKETINWLAQEPDRTFTLFGKDEYIMYNEVTEHLNRAGRTAERFTSAAGLVATGVFVASAVPVLCLSPLFATAVLVPTVITGALVGKLVGLSTGVAVHIGTEKVNEFFNPPAPPAS